MLPTCAFIDTHHHIGRKRGINGQNEFSGSDLIDRMDRHGFHQAVVMHFVSTLHLPGDFERANDYVAEQVGLFSNRLVGAVAVNPLFGDIALRMIESYHHFGFRAIKLHPIFHGHYHVNGGAIDDVAALAAQLGLPVIIHTDFSSKVSSPYEVVALAKRFPSTTFVALHLGLHPEMCKLTPDVVKECDNILLDTSQTPDFPYDVFVKPVRTLGAERVLFGSDGPECDASVNLHKLDVAIEEYGLSPAEAECILSSNAARVFRIPTEARVGS